MQFSNEQKKLFCSYYFRQGNSWSLDPRCNKPDYFKRMEFSVLDESFWDLNKNIYAAVNR